MISDILIVCKMHAKVRREEFVAIKFKRDPSTDRCVISYGDRKFGWLFSQSYVAADCPVDEVMFFFANNTLMLACEN